MRSAPPLALALLLGSVALAGCVSPGAPQQPTANQLLRGLPFVEELLPQAPIFGPEVIVDAERGGTEPSLVVDPEGRIFVAAPTGLANVQGQRLSGQFWRSTDDGASFEHLEGLGIAGLYGPSIGGGDSDIASDAQGNLFAIDLWLGNTGLLVSEDNGDSWLRGSPVTFLTPGNDRQWIDVNQATGEVFIAVNSVSTGLWVIRSTDVGATFPQQTLAVPHADRGGCICPPGVLAVDEATGNLYLPYYVNPQGVGLAISTDGGATFTSALVPGTETAHLPDDDAGELGGAFTVIAHDTEGGLYLVWEEATGSGRRIMLQTSEDQGLTWTAPRRVHDIASGEQVFPWVIAGEPGRVAIAWYEVDSAGKWNVQLASTERARDAAAFIQVQRLNAGSPVHEGDYDRGLLGDFFELALGPDGSIHAVWNARLDGADSIVYARQTGGPKLLTGAAVPPAAPGHPLGAPGVPPVRPSPPEDVAAAVAEEASKEARELLPPPP